ncbi:acetyltransferase (GNAT) family protein [Paenibacillus methanolicus]|uniref:Acetyltransferase (GNAT) family protein n=1 Tax=Paenibacillus methanolicus TaxID=582686 RepID=A0A5S5C9Y7_9BACL|nr:acetyltransferase (GNAT) family protein [Paenibacillus methanolicus]
MPQPKKEGIRWNSSSGKRACGRRRRSGPWTRGALVGSVRGSLTEGVGLIGKLIVHPDYQNRGIGKRLMASMEAAWREAKRFELFTGDRSEKNMRLYEKLGYRVCRTRQVHEGLTLVYMEKPGTMAPIATEES